MSLGFLQVSVWFLYLIAISFRWSYSKRLRLLRRAHTQTAFLKTRFPFPVVSRLTEMMILFLQLPCLVVNVLQIVITLLALQHFAFLFHMLSWILHASERTLFLNSSRNIKNILQKKIPIGLQLACLSTHAESQL